MDLTGRVFQLRIKLGNDAMRTPEDIAAALRETARRLDGDNVEGSIRDDNGNSVGNFKITGGRS